MRMIEQQNTENTLKKLELERIKSVFNMLQRQKLLGSKPMQTTSHIQSCIIDQLIISSRQAARKNF
jgi:hypothetical protein